MRELEEQVVRNGEACAAVVELLSRAVGLGDGDGEA